MKYELPIYAAALIASALIAPVAFADTNSNNAAVSGSQNSVIQNNGGIIGSGNNSPVIGSNNGAAAGDITNNFKPTNTAIVSPVIKNEVDADAKSLAVAKGGNGGDATVKDVRTGNQSVNISNPKQHRPAANPAGTTFISHGASPENCQGSIGGGAGSAVITLNAAGSKESAACNRRMDARLWAEAGHADIAFARMCMDDDNRAAVEAVGKKCPIQPAAKHSVGSSYTATSSDSLKPQGNVRAIDRY